MSKKKKIKPVKAVPVQSKSAGKPVKQKER
jgi:hypothetical protein